MADILSLEAFEELLDRRGADLTAWPEADRAAAARLIEGSPVAADALARAQALAELIGQASVVPASPELKARILSFAAAPAGGAAGLLKALWPFGPLWRPAAALAGAAFLGIALGTVGGGLISPSSADETLSSGLSGEVMVIASAAITGEDPPNDY